MEVGDTAAVTLTAWPAAFAGLLVDRCRVSDGAAAAVVAAVVVAAVVADASAGGVGLRAPGSPASVAAASGLPVPGSGLPLPWGRSSVGSSVVVAAVVAGAARVVVAVVAVVAVAGVAAVVAGASVPVATCVVEGAVGAAEFGDGVGVWRVNGDSVAIIPARSAVMPEALDASSASVPRCVEAVVLRRGAGVSPVSFWPSASAVRATWSSSTLANRAGGPVAIPVARRRPLLDRRGGRRRRGTARCVGSGVAGRGA